MREPALRTVLLVKAVEESDPTGVLIPHGDRERAGREALRAAGLRADDVATRGMTPAVERALADRAARLARPLSERHPVLRSVLLRSRAPAWAGWTIVLAALAAGAGLAALDGSRRINILAPPVLGLLLWNLLVYLALALAAARRLLAGKPRAARGGAALARGLGRRLGPLLVRVAAVDVLLGAAVRNFADAWGAASAPLLGQRLRRWLHLGAAGVAAGLVGGLYLRGLVLRYEAGWESTFLDPAQVKALIDLLFGGLASRAGIALPLTVEQVDQLRWDGAGGGGAAAPWIHLIALLLAAIVVLPRLLLAGLAWTAERRLPGARHLPPQIEAYARLALGAGQAPLPVSVTPYACAAPAAAPAGLARAVARAFGSGARPEVRPAIAYGDEDAIRAALDADAHRVAGRVLLMDLASTPETENHGAAIVAVRDHAGAARPALRTLVVLDETAYRARFPPDAAPGRLEERRRLWRAFVAGYGVALAFVPGEAPGTGPGG